jgi:hypothetical protein
MPSAPPAAAASENEAHDQLDDFLAVSDWIWQSMRERYAGTVKRVRLHTLHVNVVHEAYMTVGR